MLGVGTLIDSIIVSHFGTRVWQVFKPLRNLLILPVVMDELYTITRGVTTQKRRSATLLMMKLRKPVRVKNGCC